ncbi:hypothetical protein AB6A40_011740 [Gnathostoma spinigerum]|uniref:Uncharacterized protein n=1 Tax=Gnathostoma spinigerum TaxID=75299 RepID=A0ABD6F3H4_9BILA
MVSREVLIVSECSAEYWAPLDVVTDVLHVLPEGLDNISPLQENVVNGGALYCCSALTADASLLVDADSCI